MSKFKTWLTEGLLHFCIRFAPRTANGLRMREHISDYFNPPNEGEAREMLNDLSMKGGLNNSIGTFSKTHLDQPYNE